MGHRADLVVVDESGWRHHYSHWAANGLYRYLAAGPDAALAFISAQRESAEWLDDVWAEGGAVVDTVARRLLWFGNDMMADLAYRRAFERVLARTWDGWQVDWAYDGLGDLAAYVGVDKSLIRNIDPGGEGDPPPRNQEVVLADDAPIHPNVHGMYYLLTARAGGRVATWPLYDSDDVNHLAWFGPGLLTRVDDGSARVRLSQLPESGLHIDADDRAMGWWTSRWTPGLRDALAERWAGWRIEFWADRFEKQVAAADGLVELPPVDERDALARLAPRLLPAGWNRRTGLDSFTEHVSRERAAGKIVDVNPAAWLHAEVQPDDASFERLAAVLAELTGQASAG